MYCILSSELSIYLKMMWVQTNIEKLKNFSRNETLFWTKRNN